MQEKQFLLFFSCISLFILLCHNLPWRTSSLQNKEGQLQRLQVLVYYFSCLIIIIIIITTTINHHHHHHHHYLQYNHCHQCTQRRTATCFLRLFLRELINKICHNKGYCGNEFIIMMRRRTKTTTRTCRTDEEQGHGWI